MQLRKEAAGRLKRSFDEAKRYYDRRHRAAEKLSPGDIVRFSAPPRAADGTLRKLDPLFRGPLVITRATGQDTYALLSVEDDKFAGTAHTSQLRLFGDAPTVFTDSNSTQIAGQEQAIGSSDSGVDDPLRVPNESLTCSETIPEPAPVDTQQASDAAT